jgi:hypothetical protein
MSILTTSALGSKDDLVQASQQLHYNNFVCIVNADTVQTPLQHNRHLMLWYHYGKTTILGAQLTSSSACVKCSQRRDGVGYPVDDQERKQVA